MSRKTKIFVGALADGVTNEDLRALFEKCGPVADCDVLGQYGFVHMVKPEDADKAIRELHGTTLKGQAIRVLPSHSNKPPKTKVFIGSLPEDCKEDELRELFQKYGNVTECAVIGIYGFVHMEKPEEAQNAINELNNSKFKGKTLRVEASTGEKRSDQEMRPMRGRGGFMGPRMHPYGPRPMAPPPHMRRDPPFYPPRDRMANAYMERRPQDMFPPRREPEYPPPHPDDLYRRRPQGALYDRRPDNMGYSQRMDDSLYSRRPDAAVTRPDDMYSRRPDYYAARRPADDLYDRRPVDYARRPYQNGIGYDGRPY